VKTILAETFWSISFQIETFFGDLLECQEARLPEGLEFPTGLVAGLLQNALCTG